LLALTKKPAIWRVLVNFVQVLTHPKLLDANNYDVIGKIATHLERISHIGDFVKVFAFPHCNQYLVILLLILFSLGFQKYFVVRFVYNLIVGLFQYKKITLNLDLFLAIVLSIWQTSLWT
jgi:hypothetical protein